MIREATLQDVPTMLEIYRPYVENTAISFEYTVPTLEAFTKHVLGIKEQYDLMYLIGLGISKQNNLQFDSDDSVMPKTL